METQESLVSALFAHFRTPKDFFLKIHLCHFFVSNFYCQAKFQKKTYEPIPRKTGYRHKYGCRDGEKNDRNVG